MAGYPRYDITKPPVDPKGMTDAELKGIVDDLEADIKDAKGMAYQLPQDIKKRRSLLIIYRSFWNLRTQSGISARPYQHRYRRWFLYQSDIPWLPLGWYDLGPLGSLNVLPDPKTSRLRRWLEDIAIWIMTPGPYVD